MAKHSSNEITRLICLSLKAMASLHVSCFNQMHLINLMQEADDSCGGKVKVCLPGGIVVTSANKRLI